MSAASALTLLSAAVSVVGLAVVYFAGYRRGRSDGYAQGYDAGTDDLEEAMAEEDEAVARLCRVLDTDRAGFRRLMRQADRNAHSSVLPDMRRHREEVN